LAIAGAIGLMAGAGVVGKRADAIVLKLARSFPVRKRERTSEVPRRDAALVAAVMAIKQQGAGIRPARGCVCC
jgi:hypothetical protein